LRVLEPRDDIQDFCEEQDMVHGSHNMIESAREVCVFAEIRIF
jgi:hypothetical protein